LDTTKTLSGKIVYGHVKFFFITLLLYRMLLLHMMGFELTPNGHQHFSTAANIYIAEKKKKINIQKINTV